MFRFEILTLHVLKFEYVGRLRDIFIAVDYFIPQPTFVYKIISFLIDESNYWMAVSYWFGYAVQDEVASDTIVMYFHTNVVNNKKQYFGCFCELFYVLKIYRLFFMQCVDLFSVVNPKIK